MTQDWQIPLSERPDWYQTEEGHWRHESYGKKRIRKESKKLNIGRND